MWKCPNCEALNDANFCAACGSPRPQDTEELEKEQYESVEEAYEVQEEIEEAPYEEAYEELYESQGAPYDAEEEMPYFEKAPQSKGNTGLIVACIAVICVGLLAIIISLVLFFAGSYKEGAKDVSVTTIVPSAVPVQPTPTVSSAPEKLLDDRNAFIETVKKELRVPNDADVVCTIGTPYIWEAAGGVELVPVTFTKNGELVAGADCNVISGEICRSIYMYTPLETEKDEVSYTNYKNGRFGFSIDVPTFLTQKQEGQNGSGATFTSADGTVELYAYGEHVAYLSENPTIDELYAFIKDGVQMNIDYDRKKDNWFVLSGDWGDKVIYDMHILKSDGTHNYFSIIYPKSREKEFDAIVTHIYKSFETGVGADSSVLK